MSGEGKTSQIKVRVYTHYPFDCFFFFLMRQQRSICLTAISDGSGERKIEKKPKQAGPEALIQTKRLPAMGLFSRVRAYRRLNKNNKGFR